MNVFQEFAQVARRLDEAGVEYALVGGVAMAFYVEPRTTKDIDLLIQSKELDRVAAVLDEFNYKSFAPPWTFRSSGIALHRFLKLERDKEMYIDVLVADHAPYDRIVKSAQAVRDENNVTVRLARKQDLIWMKSQRNSKLDQADIERLSDEETE
jgi:predicted nucleotidyltransferase